ncbi:MAG: redoxin domain-containing protein [Candidatus Krumholzibacteriota bacterium]|nr:redoxin domain-containing protein [Candidatus Krumholzibacteriota bacterium]
MQTAMTVSIFEFSTFHGYDDPMLEHLDAVRGLGSEVTGGEECDVIEVSFMLGQRKKKYWISRENHIPVRLEQVIETVPRYITTEKWSNIEPGLDIDDRLFDWQPGEGWYEYREPVLEDGLIKAGEIAPDFELDLYSGGRFKLSRQRGNLVWLVFWRVGCPPCRIEMPHLEEMHHKYGSKGLTIVGFNCADSRETVEDFFSEYKTSYLTVLDSSDEAKDIFMKQYQRIKGMSAVPLNYIIGPDGRVIRAWYGFDDSEHGSEEWLLGLIPKK